MIDYYLFLHFAFGVYYLFVSELLVDVLLKIVLIDSFDDFK